MVERPRPVIRTTMGIRKNFGVSGSRLVARSPRLDESMPPPEQCSGLNLGYPRSPASATPHALLAVPGSAAPRLGDRGASIAAGATQPSREAVVPCRLGQQAPGVCVAILGDRPAMDAVAAGMLGRHESEIPHQLAHS